MIATALRYPPALRRCCRTAVAIGNYRAPAATGQTGTISGGSRRLSLKLRMEPLLRGTDGPDLRPGPGRAQPGPPRRLRLGLANVPGPGRSVQRSRIFLVNLPGLRSTS